jgi:NADPH:quinone reductase-like Zn-dependent oxidoreductase
MRWEDVEVGEPGPGQVRLRHRAVGLTIQAVISLTSVIFRGKIHLKKSAGPMV